MTTEDEVMHLMTDPKVQVLVGLKKAGLETVVCTINTDLVFQVEATITERLYSVNLLTGINMFDASTQIVWLRERYFPHFTNQDVNFKGTSKGSPVTIRFRP